MARPGREQYGRSGQGRRRRHLPASARGGGADVRALDPTLRGRLRAAVERRHDALIDTAGLNADVFDALVLLAADAWTPAAIARGYRAVQELNRAMDDGRRQRLARLGFPADEAAELSALHTRNFM